MQLLLEVSGRLLATAWDIGLYCTASRLVNSGDAPLNLFLTKKEVLIRDVKTRLSLGCCDHKTANSGVLPPKGSKNEE